MSTDHLICTIKVTLRHIKPAIWRRLEVPAAISLFDLHRVLQVAMGWTDSHLHQFVHKGVLYGAPDPEFGMPMVSERRTTLGALLVHPKDRLLYEYDFGDGWEHDVVLELVEPARPGLLYPRVVAGKRACPPEDVGGPGGYDEFVRVMADASHEEHESMLQWYGRPFEPEYFDPIDATDALPRRRRTR
jgi:hypothetical protein